MGRLTELRNELMDNPEFKAGYEQQSQLVRIGRMLRAARESQQLTQTQLAERLHIQQSEISRLEKGEGAWSVVRPHCGRRACAWLETGRRVFGGGAAAG